MFPEYGCKDCGKDRQLYSIQRLGGKTRSALRSVRERSKQADASVCCLGGLVIISLQCICFGFFSTQTDASVCCLGGLVVLSLKCIYFRLCILASNNSRDLIELPFHYFSIPTPTPPHLCHN